MTAFDPKRKFFGAAAVPKLAHRNPPNDSGGLRFYLGPSRRVTCSASRHATVRDATSIGGHPNIHVRSQTRLRADQLSLLLHQYCENNDAHTVQDATLGRTRPKLQRMK